jgi:hypothetical protein
MEAAKLSGHRVYDLEHISAIALLANGAPRTYVDAPLGHGKPTTTLQWHAHWMPTTNRSYVDGLDDSIQRAIPVALKTATDRQNIIGQATQVSHLEFASVAVKTGCQGFESSIRKRAKYLIL